MAAAGAPMDLRKAADAVRTALGDDLPKFALQLGSGVSAVADELTDTSAIAYADIPGFPVPSVAGHAGRLVIGRLGDAPVCCLEGRVHYYEGQGLAPAVMMIRTLKCLGIEEILLTNAVGSLNRDMGPGSLMAISDHINLSGANPLIGPNDDDFGLRFPDLTEAWDPELRDDLHAAAEAEEIRLFEGVYLMVSGPSFETPAEIRAFATLGADAVGMSTVPECIVARHAGIRVAGVSTVTNLAVGLQGAPLTHEETMAEGAAASANLARLIKAYFALRAAKG